MNWLKFLRLPYTLQQQIAFLKVLEGYEVSQYYGGTLNVILQMLREREHSSDTKGLS